MDQSCFIVCLLPEGELANHKLLPYAPSIRCSIDQQYNVWAELLALLRDTDLSAQLRPAKGPARGDTAKVAYAGQADEET